MTQLDFISLFYPLRGGDIHPLVSPLLGSLSKNDADGNENAKKAIG